MAPHAGLTPAIRKASSLDQPAPVSGREACGRKLLAPPACGCPVCEAPVLGASDAAVPLLEAIATCRLSICALR